VTDERVYEVEQQTKDGWRLVGNLPVTGYAMIQALVERAEEAEWPDGTYRLLYWDQDFASGTFYLVSLRTEKQRRAEMAQDKELAA
jgi:hypothetical protein